MIRFGFPDALWGLAVIPLLLLSIPLTERRRRAALAALVGDLAPRLSRGGGRRRSRALLRILALAAGLVALADPRFGTKVEEVTRRGVDVLFVMDVSGSMRAQDIRPSRLHEAKAEVRALARRLQGERLGLVVFSGVADTLCPLTTDQGAFEMFLDLVDPGLIPVPGTDMGKALSAALGLLGEDDLKYKVVVLLTDGEDHEGKGLAMAEAAAQRGVRIHTVPVGAGPAPIPEGPDAKGFKRDKAGEIVVSKPDPDGLRRIAAATGGGFYPVARPQLELGPLAEEIASMEDRDLHAQEVRNMETRFQFPLALCLLLLLLERLLEPVRPERSRRLA